MRKMPRGQKSKLGETRWAQNGYQWVRTPQKWRMTHHVIAEEQILKRPLREGERVIFRDGDKKNLSKSNICVLDGQKTDLRKRKEEVERKIGLLQRELEAINQELTKP